MPANLTIEKPVATTVLPCYICGANLAVSKMRNHVGGHILYSMRGVADDADLLAEVSLCLVSGGEVNLAAHVRADRD